MHCFVFISTFRGDNFKIMLRPWSGPTQRCAPWWPRARRLHGGVCLSAVRSLASLSCLRIRLQASRFWFVESHRCAITVIPLVVSARATPLRLSVFHEHPLLRACKHAHGVSQYRRTSGGPLVTSEQPSPNPPDLQSGARLLPHWEPRGGALCAHFSNLFFR